MNTLRRAFVACLCAVFAGVGLSHAASVTGYVSGAQQNGAVGFRVEYPDGTVKVFGGPLSFPDLAADKKRDRLVQLLTDNGLSASAVPDNGYKVDGLPAGTKVTFQPLDTKEEKDSLVSKDATAGTVSFSGFFDPWDTPGLPAIFTAGIVTDVGELTAQISAAELDFQTDGPIICQALFQRLVPKAPAYGATINFAGDRLEVYFDPAYTVTQGGIIFGTTSPSPSSILPTWNGILEGALFAPGTLVVVPTPQALTAGCVGLAGLLLSRARRRVR